MCAGFEYMRVCVYSRENLKGGRNIVIQDDVFRGTAGRMVRMARMAGKKSLSGRNWGGGLGGCG